MTPRLPLPPGAYRRLPNYGVCRVARDVYESPALPSVEGPVHRFDDPEQRYSVRYTAQDIETCLLETMQRFRRALTTELDSRLDAVTGVDQADHTPDAAAGLIDWLARQRVGRLLTHESDITVIDLPTGFDAIMTDPVVDRVFREHYPDPPPACPERVSQGCPKEIRKRHSFKLDTRAREVLLLAKERAQAAVERIVTTVRGKATTDPRFIELEAWHTFIFLPAVKRAVAK